VVMVRWLTSLAEGVRVSEVQCRAEAKHRASRGSKADERGASSGACRGAGTSEEQRANQWLAASSHMRRRRCSYRGSRGGGDSNVRTLTRGLSTPQTGSLVIRAWCRGYLPVRGRIQQGHDEASGMGRDERVSSPFEVVKGSLCFEVCSDQAKLCVRAQNKPVRDFPPVTARGGASESTTCSSQRIAGAGERSSRVLNPSAVL